jgi:citrate synthase
MDALRTGISALAGYDPELNDRSPSANRSKALRLIARGSEYYRQQLPHPSPEKCHHA